MNRERWSCKEAWDWYHGKPWFRGCNYLPSDCCNRLAFWQALDFEKHLATMDRELALAASIGFNSIRVILEFDVWLQERDSFPARLERVLETGARHGISFMMCLANDCVVPKEAWRPVTLGEQHYDWGYHGGRKVSPHSSKWTSPGYYPAFDEPELNASYYDMVRWVLGTYGSDDRIAIWDLYNEPGNNGRGEISVPHVRRLFEVARSMNPKQPLTCGIWHGLQDITPAERVALEESDVISYHSYGGYLGNICLIHDLREFGRPLMITEWLHRLHHNTVQEMFPLFWLHRIGCWNWGFVAGLSQTYEPWEGIWEQYGEHPSAEIDFTKWQHDLFRPSLRPYDPREIALIREVCQLADADDGGVTSSREHL